LIVALKVVYPPSTHPKLFNKIVLDQRNTAIRCGNSMKYGKSNCAVPLIKKLKRVYKNYFQNKTVSNNKNENK